MIDNLIDNPLKKSWVGQCCIILPHINPDGDAIGSTMAMYLYLKKQTDTVWLILDDPVPKNLMFLNPMITTLDEFLDLQINVDAIFCMDCSDRLRFGERDILLEQSGIVINIDHHKTNTLFGDINIVDAQASSTGEVLFELLTNAHCNIDDDMAKCIYAAISTDTGSFKYSNTSARTMYIAGELIKKGIDLEQINIDLYQNNPIDGYYAFQAAINNARWEDNKKLVITAVTLDDLEKYNMLEMEAEGVVEFFRDFESVEMVILLKEKEKNIFKVSLRSKCLYDVSTLALQIGGGGHMRAAGGVIEGTMDECVAKLLSMYQQLFVR